jgi:hypothetical protein
MKVLGNHRALLVMARRPEQSSRASSFIQIEADHHVAPNQSDYEGGHFLATTQAIAGR